MIRTQVCLLLAALVVCCVQALETSSSQKTTDQMNTNNSWENLKVNISEGIPYGFQRRQDGGFDFLNYFLGTSNQPQAAQQQQYVQQIPQQQQQQVPQQQQFIQQQIPQQQQLVQQQVPQQQTFAQQVPQQQQLISVGQTLNPQTQQPYAQSQISSQPQQQQYQQLQYQQPQIQNPSSSENVQYADNTQQNSQLGVSRNGPYGGYGDGYGGNNFYPEQKPVGISVALAPKPVLQLGGGNLASLIPRIAKVLSGGGKVMFGAELGKNFYFGPVGVKPLHHG